MTAISRYAVLQTRDRDAMQRIVARVVGALLLLAAALKAQGIALAPVSAMGMFAAGWFQVALVVAEVLLGVWLILGLAPLGSWALALAVFTVFAAFSSYQAIIGRSSCGCFGRLQVNPWYAFGFDVAVLMGLVWCRPSLKSAWENPRALAKAALLPAVCIFGGTLVLAGALMGAAHLAFGSMPAAIAFFRGERVSVEPAILDLGSAEPGESREVPLTITNWTEKPIRVFGGTANCSCTVLGDLPVNIPPRESRSITVRATLKGSPGVFTREGRFLIDDNGFSRVGFTLIGQVRHPVDVP